VTQNPKPAGDPRQTTPTDDTPPDPKQTYRLFGRNAAITVLGLAALGFLPTRRIAGDPGLVAMLAALVTTLAASAAGTLPIWKSRCRHPTYSVPAQLGAMALRLVVVIGLGIAVALTGLVPLPAFLIWLGISHSGLLISDTIFARSITAYAMHHSKAPSSAASPATTESR
jgi:hypothetical protein